MSESIKTEEFIQYTKDVWQSYYEEELTEDDAIEISDNMVGLVKLLMSWDEDEEHK